ncbi:apolipophorins-like [Halyomorpha halys]|uniref:apolipophorins-like n=1 Tax=Halyomorpha halys TaxID=286706 RepID=UPI0006D4D156
MREEIASDKAIQDASKFLKEVTGVLGEQVITIAEEINKFCTAVSQLIKESVEQIRASVNEVLPKIKPSFQRIAKTLNGLLEQYIKLSVQIIDIISNKLKEHEADIKAIADATVGYVQEIGKLVGKVIITINSELEKLIKQNLETLSELPIVADIQERLKEFKDLQIPDEVFNIYHELIEALKQLVPTDEANQFLDTLTNVVEKILKREEIKNKEEVIKQLYKELVAAIKSVIALVAQNAPQTDLLKPAKLQSSFPVHLLRLPSGGIRFSLVNFLTNSQSLPGLNEFLEGIKLSLNPLDYVPPYQGS